MQNSGVNTQKRQLHLQLFHNANNYYVNFLMTVVKYSESEDSTACKLCSGSSDSKQKIEFENSYLKDHIKGKTE